MKRLWWSLVCLLALGVASACDNGGGGEMDAGREDSGGGDEDGGGPPPTPAIEIVTMRDGEGNPTEFGPADFSCSPSAPAETGDTIDFTAVVESFGAPGSPTVGNLTVQFFPDNQIPLTSECTGSCIEVTTDAAGEATVTDVPSSWYAYRIPAGEGDVAGAPSMFVDVVQYNEAAPSTAGDDVTLFGVAQSTQGLILSLLGTSLEEGTTVVTGQLFDCAGEPVRNAIVRVFDSSGEVELGFASTGPRAFYFNGEQFPSGRERRTNVDGLYGAANVPVPSDNQVRVELWGAPTEGGEPEMLGCERVQVNPGGITIMNIGPTRTDGPSSCSG